MRHFILPIATALTLFSSQAWAFSWVNGGGSKDVKAIRVLAQSGVAASVTGTSSETVLATYTLKGGTMGPNGAVRVSFAATHTNSANNKTYYVRIGSMLFATLNTTTTATVQEARLVRNRGNEASQVSFNGGTGAVVSTVAMATGSVNTKNDQLLTISGQLGSASETITLEGYTIELLPGT